MIAGVMSRRRHWYSIALLLAVTAVLLPFTTAVSDDDDTPTLLLSEDHVQSVLDQAAALLQEPVPPALAHNDEQDDMALLEQRMQRLEESTLLQDLKAKQAQVEELVISQNVQQLQNFVNRLQETYDKELTLRSFIQSKLMEQQVEDEDGNANVEDEGDGDRPDDIVLPEEDVVTLDMLQERLDVAAIVQDSEHTLMEWMREILREELAAYKERLLGPVAGHVPGEGSSPVAASQQQGGGGGACPSTNDIVQKVQQALTDYANNDGIGKYDHFQQGGAKVVHFMTSDTFSPDPDDDGDVTTWGDVWWRRYIPEDWENALLPRGWEDWSLKGLPSYLYHSVVRETKICVQLLILLSLHSLTDISLCQYQSTGLFEWARGTTRDHSTEKTLCPVPAGPWKAIVES